MQTVRACCRVLAACAAAFFPFSLEAAPTEHLVYPTPQNLSAKIEIYNSAWTLLLSWADVTVPEGVPANGAVGPSDGACLMTGARTGSLA